MTTVHDIPKLDGTGLWLQLTAPSSEVLRLIRDLARSPMDEPFAELDALIMRARALRGAPLWWTSRDPDGR